MTCPICHKPIEGNQSRVLVWYEDCRYCHRTCAAAKYPSDFENRPPPLPVKP